MDLHVAPEVNESPKGKSIEELTFHCYEAFFNDLPFPLHNHSHLTKVLSAINSYKEVGDDINEGKYHSTP